MPTHGFSTKPLKVAKVKLLAGEQKATEWFRETRRTPVILGGTWERALNNPAKTRGFTFLFIPFIIQEDIILTVLHVPW